MKKLLFLLLAITSYSGSVWAQSPGWAKRFGGQSITSGMATTVDDSGNVYTLGTLAGRYPTDFDPGIDTFYLEPDGISYVDIFISKLDSSGKFVWAKRIGSEKTDQPYSMVIDDSANIYITGYFSDTVDFDPGPGVFDLSSAGDDDVFIVKLNLSGELVWAKHLGSSFGGERAYGIALDDSANVHVTGTFGIGLDFDPGPGVFNISVKGLTDVFILKLTTGGNFVWAKAIGGSLGSASAFGITVSDSGNVYVTGYHNNYTIDMDPGSGVYNFTTRGSFILKLKGNGNFVWAKQVGGIGTFSHSVTDGGIVVDKAENVVATGYFVGTGDFDPDAGVYNMTSPGGLSVFILKLNGNGQFLWAGKIGGNQSGLAARGLDLDWAGNIYVSGGFSDTADFDPQPSVFNAIPSGESNAFLLKLNPSGSMTWMRKIGGEKQLLLTE